MTGFAVAATVVTLMQYLRLRDPRFLPLLAMFALLAIAHSRPDWSSARPFHFAAGVAGLAMVVVLSPRHHPPAR